MPSSLGPAEILVILLVALIVLGPNKLPGAARQVGKTIAEVRKWSQGFQDEIRTVIDPDSAPPSYADRQTPEPTPIPMVPAETDIVPEAPPPPPPAFRAPPMRIPMLPTQTPPPASTNASAASNGHSPSTEQAGPAGEPPRS
jgi:Tat protein translocase TatB subunit